MVAQRFGFIPGELMAACSLNHPSPWVPVRQAHIAQSDLHRASPPTERQLSLVTRRSRRVEAGQSEWE
ncbi:hypothetical protein CEXT_189551 [Caerostris extrusa]|uniref:Uncharacterized protein n=1 Tax=Caerostris extrusa TaxID=172846 RepID=A0AAV4X1X1_CAEEX|nr:hypothetical protein CEXT_189551 [Caerostris extrusa]